MKKFEFYSRFHIVGAIKYIHNEIGLLIKVDNYFFFFQSSHLSDFQKTLNKRKNGS